jgi:hypothetical protein
MPGKRGRAIARLVGIAGKEKELERIAERDLR